MRTIVSSAGPEAAPADLLALACDEESLTESAAFEPLDAPLAGALKTALKDERFRAKPGQQVVLPTGGRLPAARVAVVGVGARAAFDAAALRAFAGRAVRIGLSTSAARLAVAVPAPLLERLGDRGRVAELLAQGVHLGAYRFDKYLAEDKRTPRTVSTVELLLGAAPVEDASGAVARGERVAAAVARARDWVNEPAGVLTPTRLAQIAVELAAEAGLGAQVFGPDECRRMGMGLYLAVAQGSTEEPRFIHLAWKPAAPKMRVALIGKGVTFDSGGLSLKPNDAMLDMKTDMAGAAAVIAAASVAAAEKLPVEVHALAACTENMLSGRSYKLGDVIRSKAGKTVEINNTDAEGRLTLADAITYARELGPDQILDFATLTGACMVALGPHIAGVMGSDQALVDRILASAKRTGEAMWPLPLPDRLKDMLRSEIADMKNSGERWGGALTAGLFLREFTEGKAWAHLDIAGPSSADKEYGTIAKGGTGFGVATLLDYLVS
jgi:leucyl aminopeptidase